MSCHNIKKSIWRKGHYTRISVLPVNSLIAGRWLLKLYDKHEPKKGAEPVKCGEGLDLVDICHGIIPQRSRLRASEQNSAGIGTAPYETRFEGSGFQHYGRWQAGWKYN